MLQNKASTIWKLLGAALMVCLSGCAMAYKDYQECRIPYVYCTPPPLPYVAYKGGHCPTPDASGYLREHGTSATPIPASDVPVEAPTPSQQEKPVAPMPP